MTCNKISHKSELKTPNGSYICRIIEDEDKVYSKYANDIDKPEGVLICNVMHNNPSRIEKFLGLDSIQRELTYLFFKGKDAKGNFSSQTEVDNVDYNTKHECFMITFHHSITFEDGLSTPLPKRTIKVPISQNLSERLKKCIKDTYSCFR